MSHMAIISQKRYVLTKIHMNHYHRKASLMTFFVLHGCYLFLCFFLLVARQLFLCFYICDSCLIWYHV